MPGRVPQLEDEIRSLIGRLGEDLEKKNLSASGAKRLLADHILWFLMRLVQAGLTP